MDEQFDPTVDINHLMISEVEERLQERQRERWPATLPIKSSSSIRATGSHNMGMAWELQVVTGDFSAVTIGKKKASDNEWRPLSLPPVPSSPPPAVERSPEPAPTPDDTTPSRRSTYPETLEAAAPERTTLESIKPPMPPMLDFAPSSIEPPTLRSRGPKETLSKSRKQRLISRIVGWFKKTPHPHDADIEGIGATHLDSRKNPQSHLIPNGDSTQVKVATFVNGVPYTDIASHTDDIAISEECLVPVLVAFLFAMPDEPTIKMLDQRGEYFRRRSGETWDLYFPGYWPTTQESSRTREKAVVGTGYTKGWDFREEWFNMHREAIARQSGGRWQYSGGSDLVLFNSYVPEPGSKPFIDWDSCQSGTIGPEDTLASVIEKITLDIETGNEDPHYGVGHIVNPGSVGVGKGSATKEFLIQALAGIASALAAKKIG